MVIIKKIRNVIVILGYLLKNVFILTFLYGACQWFIFIDASKSPLLLKDQVL
jgi:hypothetical protein